MDRNLQRVRAAVDDKLITPEQGRELTETFIRSGTGKGADSKPAPSATPAVRKAIERAADSGRIRVSRPSGSVDISSGDRATGAVDFDVDPPVGPVTQTSPSTCWAAAGAMLLGWWRRQSLSAESAADELGAGWRAKLDGDQALTASEMTGYAAALGLAAESPMCYLPRGLLRLLEAHGPLWVIGDDAIDGDALVHVRIVTGIHGDGSPDGTRVSYLDPADGQAHEEPFAVFAQHLEAGDAAALNLGIHHY
ncbi:papain-like cysteine protease family protein [Kitasatospora gansuensis]